MTINNTKYIIVLLLVFFGIFPLRAFADSQFDIDYCKTITDDTKRLACFDKLVASASASQSSWTGSGEKSLPPFNVTGPWTIHWSTADSNGVTIFIYNEPPPSGYADAPSSSAPGEEDSYETVTGTIYLKINGYGPWKVWITPTY